MDGVVGDEASPHVEAHQDICVAGYGGERLADRAPNVGLVEDTAAQVPQAVAEFGSAGLEGDGGEVQAPREFFAVAVNQAFRRVYLKRDSRKGLGDGVVQFGCQTGALVDSKLRVGL